MSLGLPEIGTGSNYFSQYDSDIQALLSRIYDNNSNVILAKDVRDPIWSLWNRIQQIGSQSLTQSFFYTLGTPSTISVGGIPEGSTFSNATLSDIFDLMLLPYVAPNIQNFTPSIKDIEFGSTSPISLSYSINVGSVPLDGSYAIRFASPNSSSLIPNKFITGNDPEVGTTNNFSLTYSTSTISVVSYAIATMSFRTTDMLTFSATTSIAQKHRRYYGQLTIPGGFDWRDPASFTSVSTYLTYSTVKGLSYSELSTNVNFSQIVDFSDQYFVFAAPSVFGFNYPVGFYVDNIFNQNFTKIKSNWVLPNQYNYQVPYDVYIINDKFYEPALISTIPLPFGYLTSSFVDVIPSVIIGDQGPQGPTGSTIYLTDYTSLVNLINTNSLTPNAYYEFIFQTIHYIQFSGGGLGFEEIHYGATESVRAKAITNNQLTYILESIDFPTDIIYWRPDFLDREWDAVKSGSTQSTGYIVYRKDPTIKFERDYDFRNVIFRRWETINGSGIYDSYLDTGFAYQDYNQYDLEVSYNSKIGSPLFFAPGLGFPYWLDNTIAKQLDLNNNINFAAANNIENFLQGNFINGDMVDNKISLNLISNYIDTIRSNDLYTFEYNSVSTIINNYIFGGVYRNIGKLIAYNSISGGTISNNTVYTIYGNTSSNPLINENDCNEIKDNVDFSQMENNTINRLIGNNFNGYSVSYNNGSTLQYNNISGNFYSNLFNSIDNNTISKTFSQNSASVIYNNNISGVITRNSFLAPIIGKTFSATTGMSSYSPSVTLYDSSLGDVEQILSGGSFTFSSF